MKNLKIGNERIKIDPITKDKIIKFCLDHPKEKQLCADAYNLNLRTLQRWVRAVKKPEKPIDHLKRMQIALKKINERYPNYFN
jgi:hypothetical protein